MIKQCVILLQFGFHANVSLSWILFHCLITIIFKSKHYNITAVNIVLLFTIQRARGCSLMSNNPIQKCPSPLFSFNVTYQLFSKQGIISLQLLFFCSQCKEPETIAASLNHTWHEWQSSTGHMPLNSIHDNTALLRVKRPSHPTL